MSTGTKIEWTDTTWNPIVGCSKISPGCANCYAATMAKRLAAMGQKQYAGLTDERGNWTGKVNFVESSLNHPLHWRKPRRVFVCSMSDLFHESVPFEWIDRVFAVMAMCPQHQFQVLTKRPERMAEYLNGIESDDGLLNACDGGYRLGSAAGCLLDAIRHCGNKAIHEFIDDTHGVQEDDFGNDREIKDRRWPLPNVWLGTSVENQEQADARIPHLLRCPAAVRWLSCEPLLGPIDLSAFFGGEYMALDGAQPNYNFGISWVVIGGESGHGARPCDIQWIRDIVLQCGVTDVPVFVKQLGAEPRETQVGRTGRWSLRTLADPKGGRMDEWPEDLRVREWPRAID
jgi:protein gp37